MAGLLLVCNLLLVRFLTVLILFLFFTNTHAIQMTALNTFESSRFTAKDCSRPAYFGLNRTLGLRDVSLRLLPSLPPSRYALVSPQRKVEMLRISEGQRGFSGHPKKVRAKLVPIVITYFRLYTVYSSIWVCSSIYAH